MTRTEFIHLYNARRQSQMEQGYYPIKFPEFKSKTVKKRITQDMLLPSGVPDRVVLSPKVSKQVVDTNSNTRLYQAVWEYFLGTKCKRVESEGRYREGVGYIPSANKGHSDLTGMYNGKVYYIEVKQPKEKHLQSQVDFCRWVNAGGGQYHTVRSFEDMYELVQSILRGEPMQSEQL